MVRWREAMTDSLLYQVMTGVASAFPAFCVSHQAGWHRIRIAIDCLNVVDAVPVCELQQRVISSR